MSQNDEFVLTPEEEAFLIETSEERNPFSEWVEKMEAEYEDISYLAIWPLFFDLPLCLKQIQVVRK